MRPFSRFALVAIALVAGVLWWSQCATGRDETVPSETAGTVLPVQTRVAVLSSGYLSKEKHVGRIVARRSSDLGFDLSGRLERIAVDEGATVEAGDVLAELDVRRLETRRAGLIAHRKEVEARLALARLTAERRSRLHEKESLSEQSLDQALFEMKALEAQLAASAAELEDVKTSLDLSRLRAPFPGTIETRFADEGTVVGHGEPVLRLVESGTLEIRIGVPSETADTLQNGTRYDVTVGDRKLGATLEALLPTVTTHTRSVTAVFQLENPHEGVRVGDLATLEVEREVSAEGFWLPLTALAESQRGLWAAYVLVPDPSGALRVDRRQLHVLHVEADRAFVRGTLRDGDQVVSDGLHRLVPGQIVQRAAPDALSSVRARSVTP